MANGSVKDLIKQSGFYQWQIANMLGISEMTLIRWLRTPLSKDREARIFNALEALKGGVSNVE